MANAFAGSIEQLLQRARELGLIDDYACHDHHIYIEAASIRLKLNHIQAQRWLEAALDAFMRVQGGKKWLEK